MPLALIVAFSLATTALQRDGNLPRALARTLLAVGLVVAVSTEVLSSLGALSRGPVTLTWLLCAGVALAASACRRSAGAVVWRRLRPSSAQTGVLGLLLVLLGLELLVALASPPNNWDSMTYHLARVGHWIQNHSVSFYATSIDRQLWSQPWSEYAVTHVQLLSGTVRASNLVQWAAGAGTAVGAVRLAALFGLDRWGQILGALLALTWPMAIMQSSSTQTDLTTGLWVLLAAGGFLADLRVPSTAHKGEAFAATALALLTKSTGAFFLLAFAVAWFVGSLRRDGRAAIRAAAAGAIVVVALNAPFQARVIAQWHRPFTTASAAHDLGNQGFARGAFANALRNGAALAAPPSNRIRGYETSAVVKVNNLLGIPRDDPRTLAFPPYAVDFGINESEASAPFQLAVLLVSAVMLVIRRRRLPPLLVGYALATAAGYLIYCGFVKWQPWGNRLLLPFMLLASIPMAYVLRVLLDRRVSASLAGVSLLAAVGYLALNDTRPLYGKHGVSVLTRRADMTLFAARPELAAPYRAVVDFVRASGATRVGLIEGADDWEYPIFAMLGGPSTTVRLYDVVPADAATYHQPPGPAPQLVICLTGTTCGTWEQQGWRRHAFGPTVALLTP